MGWILAEYFAVLSETLLEQKLDEFKVFLVSKCRSKILATLDLLRVFSAMLEEKFGVFIASSPNYANLIEKTPAFPVFCLDISAIFKQSLKNFDITLFFQGIRKDRPSPSLRIYISTILDQELSNFCQVSLNSEIQGEITVLILVVDISALLDEKFRQLLLLIVNCKHQRILSFSILGIEVGTLINKTFNQLYVSTFSSCNQGGLLFS